MNTWRGQIIPTLLRLSGNKVTNKLAEIRKIALLDGKDSREYQETKLRQILLYSWRNIPYYHHILEEAGTVQNGKVALANFDNIPILTKDIIREKAVALRSKERRARVHENTSGGSTGEPVRFLQDKEYNEWNIATKLYFLNELFGKHIGQPEVNLWGSERDIYRNSLGLKQKVINFLYGRTFLNAFRVSEEDLARYVRIIDQIKPMSMWTYAAALDVLARFIEKNHLNITHSPMFIISTAGMLYPAIRERAERVFKCSVYDQYGSREVGPVAIECPLKNGLHEFFWMNYTEIVDSKIYVTTLNNYVMPLLRYEIGDMATGTGKIPCECGRSKLKFKQIKGRVVDHFKTSHGELVHGQYFIHQFYYVDWVKKFQIVQKEPGCLICRIVLSGEADTVQMEQIERNIHAVMGNNCKVDWEFVEEIRPSKSGKYRYTISAVP